MNGGVGLLLAPGAGASRDQPALVAVDRAASAAGVAVVRMDFPYRLAGRRAPDRQPVLVNAVRDAAATLSGRGRRVVAGGRSMGARICSIAVAEGMAAAGLVLISYPLHPPRRPEQLRTGHFHLIEVPCLFVSGTRDSFGTPAELEAATRLIAGPVAHHWVEGRDHGLRGAEEAVAAVVVEWFTSHIPV